jgi:hypothetical protein
MKRRWEPVMFALLMSALMSVAIAFFLPLLNGASSGVLMGLWLGGTAAGFLISFPVSLVAVPMVRRVLDRFIE